MEKKIIDEAFYVEKAKWGTWKSYNLEGKCLITSLTEENCIRSTRFYLKGIQDGWDQSSPTYEGTVGGKL